MKPMKSKLFLFALALFAVQQLPAQNAEAQKPIRCTVRGTVVDRPYSNRLMLLKLGDDPRTANAPQIPIRNGKFEYTFECDHEEMYNLIFLDELEQGSFYGNMFLSETGTIEFILYPEDDAHKKNRVEGGALNEEYRRFRAKLWETTEPLWDALGEINIGRGEGGTSKIVRGHEHVDDYNFLRQLGYDMKLQYVTENVGIPGYFLLYELVQEAMDPSPLFVVPDIESVAELFYRVYYPKYPGHPLSEKVSAIIEQVASIKPGGRYIDVEVTDMEGRAVRLSDQIGGKVALLNVWASWCGPCRRKAIDIVIPVYEKYKDSGFTVVGIAREEAVRHAEAAIARDGYKWLNLIDLNDRAGVGLRYGQLGLFLIDRDGTILAVNPTTEEMERILKEKL
jgi:thiol-disulfide isomerase/thioredoxin